MYTTHAHALSWVRLLTLIGIVFAGTLGVQATVLVRDDMEGGGVPINPLVGGNLDANATYTITASNPSPFTAAPFGASTKSGLLTDNSTAVTPYISRTCTGNASTNWVHVQFDFRPISGSYTQWTFTIGEGANWPYACCLSFYGGGFAVSLSGQTIPIPNVTATAGDWYHVDALLRPSGWSDAFRTYDVTLTQDHAGVRTTGSLTGVLQSDTNPTTFIRCWHITDGDHTRLGAMQFDNVLVETFAPTTLIDDGVFEAPATKPLQAENTSGTATYSAISECSPIANQHFTTNTCAGDLHDNDATQALLLKRDNVGAAVTDYVHAQFDFKPVSGTYSQWAFVLGDDAPPSSPSACSLRFNGANLAVYGRKNTSEACALLNIPNVTVNTSSWYHVDVTFRPTYLAAAERTYNVRVTQFDGVNTYIGAVCGVLNEDSGRIICFRVATSTAASTGRLYLDNVQIEGLHPDMAVTPFRYGYWPTSHHIRYLFNTPPSCATGWTLKLIRVSDGAQQAEQSGTLPLANLNGHTMSIPALADGNYTLQLFLTGNGFTEHVLERTFPHVTYPWVNNTLGKDDVVIPPFTPFSTTAPPTVDTASKTVKVCYGTTAERYHAFAGNGLWSSATSETVELLNSRMRFEVNDGATTYTDSGTMGALTVSANGTSAGGTASWSAGPIAEATTTAVFDYDGMMKVTVHLPATQQNVASLKLVIPLKDTEALHYHAVTDYLRMHPGRRIPDGAGTVWDSSSLSRSTLPAPFVPYIWVGGAARGLCWFADNDKDWILDGTNPVLALTRSAGEVALVVTLIKQATARPLTRARDITFGLMTTPAKPMPSTPVSWRNWWPGSQCDTTANSQPFHLAGACYYWGAHTPFTQHYPAFKNFSLYDAFATSRQTGQRPPTSFFNPADGTGSWMAQFSDAAYADLRATYVSHLNWMFQTMTSSGVRAVMPLATVVQDALNEGTRLLPVSTGNMDGNCSWTFVGANPSPFTSVELGTSTTKGQLVDNSAAVTPYIQTAGFGLTSTDWVNVQFDIRPVSGEYTQWELAIGYDAWYPYASDLRFSGANGFRVVGRRKPSDGYTNFAIPNITVAAGEWYHVDITYTPVGYAAPDRKYDITISHINADGSRTTGTLRGILQEDSNPINLVRFWHYSDGVTTRTGTIEYDNLLVRKVKPTYLIPYTNARGYTWSDGSTTTATEVGTYLDEWSLYDVADPRWDTAVANGQRKLREHAANYNQLTCTDFYTTLEPSYLDQALYYDRQMLDQWANGIYRDNCFLQANYYPAAGSGYVGDDGVLHPGVSLFAFREYIKRSAVMQYKMDMPPMQWIHMTNVNIVPILSFATINYDWEWYGPYNPTSDPDMDAQERYGLDNAAEGPYPLVVSSGLQAGNVPVILDEFGTSVWTHRTALAVCLPHEIKIAGWDATVRATALKLQTFGYGLADCRVYRYWETQPVTMAGTAVNVKALVLKRPNGAYHKAYLVLGSFGNGGNCDVTLDAATLGLPAGYRVYDDESGTELPPMGANQYRVAITRHDFKLIRIE